MGVEKIKKKEREKEWIYNHHFAFHGLEIYEFCYCLGWWRMKRAKEPYSCKNWKAGFSRSSSAGFTSVKSFSCREFERSSTENGMLHISGACIKLVPTFMEDKHELLQICGRRKKGWFTWNFRPTGRNCWQHCLNPLSLAPSCWRWPAERRHQKSATFK